MTSKLFFILVLSMIAGFIEVIISAPSLPDISDYFAISDGLTQMTIAVNFFGFCLSAVAYGPLSERYGRRNIMIIGNGLMLIGAFFCVISKSIEFLLFARFLQGIGASTSAVIVMTMVADLCDPKQTATIFGKILAKITIVTSIAPILGGFINESIGWRGNYAVVFVISLVSWLLLVFFLPETNKESKLITVKSVWGDYRRLLTSYSFMEIALLPCIMFAGFMAFVSCAAFLYTETFGVSMVEYALHQATIITCFSFCSQKSGAIREFFGTSRTINLGLSLRLTAGLLLSTVLLELDSAYLVTISVLIMAFANAISYPIFLAKSLDIFPELKGPASSTGVCLRMLITGCFVSFMGIIYDGTLLNVAIVLLTGIVMTTLLTIPIIKRSAFSI